MRKFQLNKIGRKILYELRSQTKLMRLEREKQDYKQKMWSKVNTWLHDLDTSAPVLKGSSRLVNESDSIMTQDAELHLRDTNVQTAALQTKTPATLAHDQSS